MSVPPKPASFPGRREDCTSSAPPQVRAARGADQAALEALEALFPGDRLTPRAWRHMLTRAHGDVLVVEQAGAPVANAVVLYRRGSRAARLYSLIVHPRWERRGIASSLVAAAEARCAARGCAELRLEVRADNAGAIALYQRRGYRERARRAHYYEDGADALCMTKQLAPTR